MRTLLAAAAILLATLPRALAAPELPGGSCGFNRQDRIRFHFGANHPPFDYLVDEPLPYTHVGFGVEFATLLCEKYELNCSFVRAPYDECWLTSEFPGRGVADGSFDACSAYTDTYLRRRDPGPTAGWGFQIPVSFSLGLVL